MKLSRAIFKTFFLSLAIIANVHFAWAQQSIVPNGYQTYLDQNGKPLSSGKVFYYTGATGSTVPKTTYQDIGGTTPNTNPIILNAAGRALVWGTGNYRQIVQDKNNNIIWDTITSAAGSGSGGGGIATGDGDLVGTIKPWAGILAPNQYAFAFGQELNRTTFTNLFTAITQSSTVICTSSSATVTGVSDTTQIPIGAPVELTCVPAGTTVVSKTTNSVTLSNPSNISTNAISIFFPFGNGNGTTTFNVPDLRGYVIAGRDNMGNSVATRLPSAFDSTGGTGGNQNQTLVINNIPSLNPTLNFNDPGHSHTYSAPTGLVSFGSTNVPAFTQTTTSNTGTSTTGITASINHIGGSGAATTAIKVAVGSGYTNGAQILTVAGGTCTVQPTFNVTITANVVSAVGAVATAGNCSVPPVNPASTTGGGGTGATLDVSYTAQPFSVIQPTFSLNYIIKVTPDSAQLIGNIASLTQDNTFTGNNYFGGGRPWCDVVAKGAKGDGVTDDSAAIQICITTVASLGTLGAGQIYFPTPNVSYCVKTPLTITTILTRLVGESEASRLSACGVDITPLTINGAFISIENLGIFGFDSPTATQPALIIGSVCSSCRIKESRVQRGNIAILMQGTDVIIENTFPLFSYGSAIIKATGNGSLFHTKVDQNYPGATPAQGTTFNAWASGTSYTTGTIVSTGGFYIENTQSGTSGSVAPTLQPYQTDIIDNTAKWRLVSPTTYYGLQLSTGAFSFSVSQSDFTGSTTAGIALTDTNNSTIQITDSYFGASYTASILALAGNGLIAKGNQFQNCINPGCAGISLGTSYTGDTSIESNNIFLNPIGINIQSGISTSIIGNSIAGSSTSAINIATNVTDFIIANNKLGSSSVWGINAKAVVIQTGSSDFYNVTNNLIHNATSGITDGGTGTHKTLTGNQ